MIWPLVSAGSVFILTGSTGNRTLFIVGVALMLVAFGIALFLALGRRTGPRPAGVYWVLGGFATIYVVAAVVGGATAERDADPFPGIGLDDSTPLGDSPELSDAREQPERSGHHA